MKAWRKEAEKINARRKAGSKEPRARAQMQTPEPDGRIKHFLKWLGSKIA